MKILLIGPLPDPITGNSIANLVVVKELPKCYSNHSVNFINTSFPTFNEALGVFSLKKLLYYAKNWLYAYKIFFADIIYMTPGQTFYGVLKGVPFVFLAKLLRKPVVVHIHGNFLGEEYANQRGWKKKIFEKVLLVSSKGIVLSDSLRNNLSPFLSDDKIYTISNFVEDFLFEYDIDTKSFETLKIFYLSNLMKEKGILDLLEALIVLKEKGIDFSAKIAGHIDVSLKPIIDKYLKELQAHVIYLGVVKGEAKRNLLVESNVFVFPTYYKMEGQPISIFEAMATGNIILTTKHAGIPDVFEDGINGFYIEKQNSESLVNKIMEVSDNLVVYKQIGFKNAETAKKKYRVKRYIDDLVNVFEK